MEEPSDTASGTPSAPANPPKRDVPGAQDPVPVVIASNDIMAHIIKSVLDDAGIHAAVVGSNTASALPHWGAILNVQVLVARADYERARDAVRASLDDPGALSKCSACGYDLEGLEKQERCPECGAKFVDMRQRVTIAPPPGPTVDPVARAGAVIGLLVIAGVLIAAAAGLLWMLSGTLARR